MHNCTQESQAWSRLAKFISLGNFSRGLDRFGFWVSERRYDSEKSWLRQAAVRPLLIPRVAPVMGMTAFALLILKLIPTIRMEVTNARKLEPGLER
jgi:hypothetical protein